ncbi:MAG: hypothetical protein GXX96_05560 [Planctomycetaceae bacterium]|nr:hypothetical protein [Planctomycetaceae bacterium]
MATYNASTNVTTIANHKVYEAFGKVHSESGPTVDTLFGYTGRYFDDDAGLQWNLNRANKRDRSNIERDVDAAGPTGS